MVRMNQIEGRLSSLKPSYSANRRLGNSEHQETFHDLPILQRYRKPVDTFVSSLLTNLMRNPNYTILSMLKYHYDISDSSNSVDTVLPGKLIRPTLCLLTVDALTKEKGQWENAVPAASAVEILHNFTLIYDDIMDKDILRHGRPTVWSVFGENDAILAGITGQALSTLVANMAASSHSPEIAVKISNLLNTTAIKIAQGQQMDLQFERNTHITVEEYLQMINLKTGTLIETSIEMGAILAGADEVITRHLKRYGETIGKAFQLKDDLLGSFGDPKETGKANDSDIARRKMTYPIVYAMQHANEHDRLILDHIYTMELPNNDSLESWDIAKVKKILENTKAQEALEQVINNELKTVEGIIKIIRFPNEAREWARRDFIAIATELNHRKK